MATRGLSVKRGPFRVPYRDSGNGTVLLLFLSDQSTDTARGAHMPGVDFERLRAEVTMRQVLQLLHFQSIRCHGEQWYGQCPLPGCQPSRQPSFSVNVAMGRYYCHRCRRHGHQLELWAAATGLPLYPAAIDLCAALRREVPWIQRW
jgi:hypothetical protein